MTFAIVIQPATTDHTRGSIRVVERSCSDNPTSVVGEHVLSGMGPEGFMNWLRPNYPSHTAPYIGVEICGRLRPTNQYADNGDVSVVECGNPRWQFLDITKLFKERGYSPSRLVILDEVASLKLALEAFGHDHDRTAALGPWVAANRLDWADVLATVPRRMPCPV